MKLKHRFSGVEKIDTAKFTITYKDVFSLKYVYFLLHEWLVEQGYCSEKDEQFPEMYYLQKENPAVGKEIWWRWRLGKQPAGAVKFWRFMLDIDVHVLGLNDAEIMVKDKKIKVNKGEIEFQVASYVVYDVGKEWEKSSWLKPFKKVYVERVAKSKVSELKKELNTDVYRLQDALKTYLKLENLLPEKEGEGFWNKRTGE